MATIKPILTLTFCAAGCALQNDGATGDDPSIPTQPAIVVEGEITWTLTFDEDAQAGGFYDCAYTRQFQGQQVLDMDYLCPACITQVQGIATMSDGLDCYSQISANPTTERTEHWGWSASSFFRTGSEQAPLGELSPFEDNGQGSTNDLSWSSESTLSDSGTMVLAASGTMTWEVDEDILIEDPWAQRTQPYTCGWPMEDPGTLALDYSLAIGETFPNVRLADQCGDQLALWDLYGRWLVLDTSQSDCGPCQSMAAGAEAFVTEMAEDGIEVMVVGLLGNGLSNPYGTPSESTFEGWISTFNLSDPVLYDRGFAYALFPEFIEETTGDTFGYPTWLVVDPSMTLVYGNVGFGSWDDVGDVIRANAQ